VTGADLRGRKALETTVLAYCYGSALAGARVALRDLAELPGPHGAPVGLAAAAAAARDLEAEGLLLLHGLDGALSETLLLVEAPGQALGGGLRPAPPSRPRSGQNPGPPWSTGERVFNTLWLPKNLPTELMHMLRKASSDLAEFNQAHGVRRMPLEEREALFARRAEVLTAWSEHTPKNQRVRDEAERAQRALEDLRRQVQSHQAKSTAA